MGGGQDAHIDHVLDRRSQLAHTLFLDRAQQLDLHRQGQVCHFVEEQRPAVCGLEKAVALLVRAGKGALAVPEELAFHQVLGNRTAIHRDEGLLAPRAIAMDQAGRELLAAAGFARDVDRRLRSGELADQFAHLPERCAVSKQLLAFQVPAAFQPGQGQRRFDQRAQPLERDRFGNVIERARL